MIYQDFQSLLLYEKRKKYLQQIEMMFLKIRETIISSCLFIYQSRYRYKHAESQQHTYTHTYTNVVWKITFPTNGYPWLVGRRLGE